MTIIIYSSGHCVYCDMAKDLLTKLGLSYDEYRIDLNPEQLDLMLKRTKRRTVPQIFIDEYHVGGFDELNQLHQTGELNRLLKKEE